MDEFQEAALATANRARAALGLPAVDHLYPGYAGEAEMCAISNTIYDDDLDRSEFLVATGYSSPEAKVVDVGITIDKGGVIVYEEIPDEKTRQFLIYFDDYRYPELLIGEEPWLEGDAD